ncbi:hypothetical protein ACTXKQ_07230 [Corynebacterium variabile]|uniref:hypothetical protein n=2 Tax=Corynebacterium variabile TaxID=1727 RepID=UPI001146500B|nr:hypothetical protein [Corynebacterium variabile]
MPKGERVSEMDFSEVCNVGVRPGDPEDHGRSEIGVSSKGRPVGAIEVGGAVRDVTLMFGGGTVYEVELTTLLPGDTFQGVPLTGSPDTFVEKLRSKGYAVEFDFDNIEISSPPIGFFVVEEQVSSICWRMPRG